MNKEEFSDAMGILRSAFPYNFNNMHEAAKRFWFSSFSMYSRDEFQSAIEEYLRGQQRNIAPQVGTFLDIIESKKKISYPEHINPIREAIKSNMSTNGLKNLRYLRELMAIGLPKSIFDEFSVKLRTADDPESVISDAKNYIFKEIIY